MSRPPVVSAILAAGGVGARLGADRPKQFLDIHGRSMLELSLAALATHPGVHEVIVALPARHLDPAPACLTAAWPCRVTAVAGGKRRQDSVAAAFAVVGATTDVVLVHDAARPFASADLVSRMIAAAAESGAAVPAVPVADTVKRGEVRDGRTWVTATLPRTALFLAQTPQAFTRTVLASALATAGAESVTDEADLVERAGGAVQIVDGEAANVKITTAADLAAARGPSAESALPAFRIGSGYDLHRLVPDRALVLAGVRIPFELGLDGHSDADIICHAVTDAVLGAAAIGDIGRLFPDTDATWKDADSLELLGSAVALVHGAGFRVGNVDVTVIAERPKLLPHLAAMRANLAAVLQVEVASVSVKGKTNERVDSMGRGESMACHAVALLVRAASEPRVPSPEPRR